MIKLFNANIILLKHYLAIKRRVKMGYKSLTFYIEENILKSLRLIKNDNGDTVKDIINEILREYLITYAKKKKVSDEIIKMVEKRLAHE